VVAGYVPDLVLLAFFTGNDIAITAPRLTHAPRVYSTSTPTEAVSRRAAAPTASARALARPPQPLPTCGRRRRCARAAGGRPRLSRLEPGSDDLRAGRRPRVEHAWRLTPRCSGRLRRRVEGVGRPARRRRSSPAPSRWMNELWSDLVRRARTRALELEREGPSPAPRADRPRRGHPARGPRGRPSPPPPAARPGRPGLGRSPLLLGRFHLSDEGHRVVAEALHRFLVGAGGEGLLEPY